MATTTAAFGRDANFIPITTDGLTVSTTLTTNANNTTVNPPIFTVAGTVEIRALWGVVTTDLSSAHTVAYWRLNDQTAQPAITLATGTTLSSVAAGSTIVKNGLAAAALTLINNSAGRVNEPTTLETTFFSPFIVVKKTAALTQIEYVYTTTNAPATGAIQFFVRFLPISSDGNITGVAT
jgi:hypothetical protein